MLKEGMVFGIASKAIKLSIKRPAHILANIRGTLLFYRSKLGLLFFGNRTKNIHLEQNVRIQKLRSLSAEHPNATISIGSSSIIYENAKIEAYGNGSITLGDRCIVGDVRIYSRAKIVIGSDSVFSWNVFIQDFQPHPVDPVLRSKQIQGIADRFFPSFDGHVPSLPPFEWDFPCEPVILGENIWYGANCTILPGVKIGSGSIVAAGAVVVRGEYPPGSVLAGNPARVVKNVLKQ